MDRTQALEKLRSIGQQHLLEYFDELSSGEQSNLLDQIDSINIPTLRMQQQMLVTHQHHPIRLLDPFIDYHVRGNDKDIETGQELIAQGKVACLIIAGGQGTRLKINGPKGMFPVSLIKKKSLFQILAEKVVAASNLAGRKLPVAVMTSPQNHHETLSFFAEHNLYGLDPEQLEFFIQGNLPLLDHDGNLFLENTSHLAQGPDGNGSSLAHFYDSGIWNVWYDEGVRYVNYVLIDNPLADPFDAELVGHQHNQDSDVMIKCSTRRDANEKVGVLVRHEDKVKVIEYSELPPEEMTSTTDEGQLKHRCANLSLFSFSMDFIKKISKADLPLHLAHKAVPFLDKTGNTVQPDEPNAWKFEKFIFDVLPHALKVRALLYPREECFAPLKNSHGDASLEKVQEALLQRDRAIIKELTGEDPPDAPIELAQDFYYPTEEIKTKWKEKPLDKEGYIEP